VTARELLRDPLLHFVAFGAAVFAVQAALAPAPPPETGADASTVIEVDAALVSDLRRVLTTDLERLPTTDELDRAVEAWIETEILVREARARGLGRGDPQIRARLAERMAFVLEAREVPDEPDEAALRALYEAVRDEYRVELQVTLRQCFAGASRDRAEALLERARAGATPAELRALCEPPPGGPVLRGRSRDRLVERYGEPFADGLDEVEVGRWHLRRSDLGWHVTRVERRRDARQLTFDEARDRLRARWQRERVADASARALETLRERYEVRGWPR